MVFVFYWFRFNKKFLFLYFQSITYKCFTYFGNRCTRVENPGVWWVFPKNVGRVLCAVKNFKRVSYFCFIEFLLARFGKMFFKGVVPHTLPPSVLQCFWIKKQQKNFNALSCLVAPFVSFILRHFLPDFNELNSDQHLQFY